MWKSESWHAENQGRKLQDASARARYTVKGWVHLSESALAARSWCVKSRRLTKLGWPSTPIKSIIVLLDELFVQRVERHRTQEQPKLLIQELKPKSKTAIAKLRHTLLEPVPSH